LSENLVAHEGRVIRMFNVTKYLHYTAVHDRILWEETDLERHAKFVSCSVDSDSNGKCRMAMDSRVYIIFLASC
jgi:hypothetical protein